MPNKSETTADAEGVGQPKREASLAAPNGYAAGDDYDDDDCCSMCGGDGAVMLSECGPSGLCGLADGVSGGLLEALGNSIVWPVAGEVIEAMIATEARTPNAPGELPGAEQK